MQNIIRQAEDIIQALDYTNKNEDGSVGKVADSLKTAFKTRNGRTVYDGGGVDPDIVIEQEAFAKIVGSLVSKQLIFDFATEFVLQNDSIEAPGVFRFRMHCMKILLCFYLIKSMSMKRTQRKKWQS